MGYTKLDENLVTSSIWSEDDKTLRVWVYLMARAGANGAVLDTIPAIARACGYDLPTTKGILDKLAGPDEYSRTPDLNGRRIAVVTEPEFAIHLVNHSKYRGKAHTAAERAKAYRSRHAPSRKVTKPSRSITSESRTERKQKQKQKQTDNGLRPDKPTAFPSPRAADVFLRFYPEGAPPAPMFKALRPLVAAKTWEVVEPQLTAYLERVPIDFHNWPKFSSGFGRWHEAPNVRGRSATAGNTKVLDEWERKIMEGIAQ